MLDIAVEAVPGIVDIVVAAVAGIAVVAVPVVDIAGIVVAVVTDTVADTEGQCPLFAAWKVAVCIAVNRWRLRGPAWLLGPGPVIASEIRYSSSKLVHRDFLWLMTSEGGRRHDFRTVV